MTDNEIIKVLEGVAEWFTEHGRNINTAVIEINRQSADLINRQKAEIERLTAERDEARRDCSVSEHNHQLAVAEREANVKGFTENLKTSKAEAIKEFAEMFEKEFVCAGGMYRVHPVLFDNLVKEMVGDDNAE